MGKSCVRCNDNDLQWQLFKDVSTFLGTTFCPHFHLLIFYFDGVWAECRVQKFCDDERANLSSTQLLDPLEPTVPLGDLKY